MELRRKLPPLVAAHLDPWHLQSSRSATVGGTGGGAFIGGGSVTVQPVMISR